MTSTNKTRLDNFLVDQGHYASRARARDAISRGCVQVNGLPATRPGASVALDAKILVNDPAQEFVSRSALKLVSGLELSGYDPSNRLSVDIGASTGGFTQVLLQKGARHVYAIDVGHGQMDALIENDVRVTSLEGINARQLTAEHLDGQEPQFLVSDVSFISLKLALPPALNLAAPGCSGIFLVKPQFEVGRKHIGRGGLVRDPALGHTAAKAIADWIKDEMGWMVDGLHPSPIAGGDGNCEYLLAARKPDHSQRQNP